MKLIDFMKQSGMSNEVFGARIGVSAESVRLYLAGRRMPRRDTLLKIAEVSGGLVTANDLVEQIEAAE